MSENLFNNVKHWAENLQFKENLKAQLTFWAPVRLYRPGSRLKSTGVRSGRFHLGRDRIL